MKKHQFSLVGFYNRRKENCFSFVLPIFEANKNIFRCEIDEITHEIISFIPFSGQYESILDIKIRLCTESETKDKTSKQIYNEYSDINVNDEAIFGFSYKQIYYFGNKIHISIELLKLLKYEDIDPLDKYDFFTFIGFPIKIMKSISNIIESFKKKSINLDQSNFYMAETINLNLEQFIEVIKYYSSIIEKSRHEIQVFDYIDSNCANEDVIRFNRFSIKKSMLRNKFEYLIEKNNEDAYLDIICHFFASNQICDVSKFNHKDFRIRKQFPEIKDKRNHGEQILLDNSQSVFFQCPNAAIIVKDIEDEIHSKMYEEDWSIKENIISNKYQVKLKKCESIIQEIKENG